MARTTNTKEQKINILQCTKLKRTVFYLYPAKTLEYQIFLYIPICKGSPGHSHLNTQNSLV